jgi:hypothetical protein
MQDACDAEFPGVSNFYPDRFGRAVFHGRLAKFDPSGVWSNIAGTDPARNAVWALKHFHVGDGNYVAGGPGSRAHIREFGFERGTSKVFNSASATHDGIRDKDIPGQLYEDATSIGLLGYRSWSRSNLLTMEGLLDPAGPYSTKDRLQGVAAKAETLLFSTYIVENYKYPRNRITTIGFRPMHDSDPRAAPVWELLCECDIADTVDVFVDSPGGGGFIGDQFFIEGVHEEVGGRAWGSDGFVIDDVTLTLDLSPRAYFDVNPFPTS